MTKRVGVSESLPDGTCPDNGSPSLCLLDESNEQGWPHQKTKKEKQDMSHLLLLGKFEYTGGPIFKVVLEC